MTQEGKRAKNTDNSINTFKKTAIHPFYLKQAFLLNRQGTHNFTIYSLFTGRYHCLYCICIMTRGEINPEHEGNPEGGAQGISRGLRLYFTVYPYLNHNTDIINF